MVTTVEQLKELILWAKQQKVRHIKMGDLEFTLSNGAIYLPNSNDLTQNQDTSTNSEGNSVPDDHLASDYSIDDDPDLFASAD
jgi:hypothetical protein